MYAWFKCIAVLAAVQYRKQRNHKAGWELSCIKDGSIPVYS